MRVEIAPDAVIKAAETEEERITLRSEARALRICAHPGVVPLLGVEGGDPPEALVLARMPGGHLGEVGSPSLPTLVGWGAAVAATLADLHDIGWSHGAVGAQHVLFDGEGRPVLCSFRRSEAAGDRSDLVRATDADVTGLATMLLDRLPEGSDRKLVRLLTSAAGCRAGDRAWPGLASIASRRPSRRRIPARQLARRLVELVPDARLGPGHESNADPGPRLDVAARRRRLVAVVVAVALVLGVGAVLAVVDRGLLPPARRPGPGSQPRQLTLGAARFVLSGPPGADLVAVIGRWDCGPDRPAVMDLRTGWIWVFDGWPPPGSADSGHPVDHIPEPRGLVVRRSGSNCEQLVVLERSGRTTVVPVPAGG